MISTNRDCRLLSTGSSFIRLGHIQEYYEQSHDPEVYFLRQTIECPRILYSDLLTVSFSHAPTSTILTHSMFQQCNPSSKYNTTSKRVATP